MSLRGKGIVSPDCAKMGATTKDGPGGAGNTVTPGLTPNKEGLMADTMPRASDDAQQARDATIEQLRTEFVRWLTVDSEHRDRRRRDFNQAIFDPSGYAIWNSTDLHMVLEKFDRAVRTVC